MNNWDRNRQDMVYKQKLQNVKSTLPKIIYNNNNTISKRKKSSNFSSNLNINQNTKYKLPSANIPQSYDKQKDFKKQNYLKHLLNEFGLSQYLRKIFELGYDDNNFYKIGLLSRREFDDLVYNIHIFPGQMVKMENFYDYLKQMNFNKGNNNVYSNKPKSSTGTKRIVYPNQNYGTTPISSNTTRPNTTTNILMKNKPSSVTPNSQRDFNSINNSNSNNKIIKAFSNGDFNYNYFLQDNIKGRNSNNINKFSTQQYDDNLKGRNININNNDNNNGNEIEEKMSNDVDNMLKYYMDELNEKLDDSYETIEDSSLSHINITSSLANVDLAKIENEKNIKENNSPKNKIPSTINSLGVNPPINKKPIPVKLPGIKKEENTNINMNNNNNNNSNDIILKSKDQKRKTELKPIEKKDSKNIEKTEKEEEEIIEETLIKNEKEENNKKEEKKKLEPGFINFEEIEENFEPIKEQNKLSLSPPIQMNKYTSSGNYENIMLNKNDNERYTKEQQIYDNIRLIKSSEGDYIHQNMEQFDIEYMCRCLGLAIMKHLENAKGKQHISDLINMKDFIFFNSIYNNNINILLNFFDQKIPVPKNQISNLDRLENEEKKNTENFNPYDDDIISFVSHFKNKYDEKLIKDSEIKENKSKLHGNLQEIEKDIKFIDEFFSMKKPVRNYQNVSEKSKNILCKELSYIGEVDSELTISKINTSNHVKQDEKNNNKELEYTEVEEIDDKNNKILPDIEEENKEEKEEEKEEEKKEEKEKEKEEEKEEEKKEEEKEEEEKKEETPSQKKIEIKDLKDTVNIGSIKDDKYEKINIPSKFTSTNTEKNEKKEKKEESKIEEEIKIEEEKEKEKFESGSMESDYMIDASTVEKLKQYLLKQIEIFDDDYIYSSEHIPTRKYVPPPDPQTIFEFCANIMILTKMEKEVIIISLIYLERFIFNTGLLLSPRNWRRLIFIIMVVSSKIWDDDSFENNHFAQVFTHLKLGEINLMERTFLELINYKTYVKCSEYFKYFFIIKSISLKYNYNGSQLVPISVQKMMKIQEYAYLMQKK